jgi:AbrB family looped-hinge helix DNA binding protein
VAEYDGIMPLEVAIDASGRLVIPKEVRARHRLQAGSTLLLMEEDDRLVLIPRPAETQTVERAGIIVFRGTLLGEIPDHRQLRNERIDRLAGRS